MQRAEELLAEVLEGLLCGLHELREEEEELRRDEGVLVAQLLDELLGEAAGERGEPFVRGVQRQEEDGLLRQRDGGSGDAAEQSHVLLGDEGEIVRLAAVGGEERDERVLEVQRSFLVVGLLELLGVHETRHLVEDIAMNDAPALSVLDHLLDSDLALVGTLEVEEVDHAEVGVHALRGQQADQAAIEVLVVQLARQTQHRARQVVQQCV